MPDGKELQQRERLPSVPQNIRLRQVVVRVHRVDQRNNNNSNATPIVHNGNGPPAVFSPVVDDVRNVPPVLPEKIFNEDEE